MTPDEKVILVMGGLLAGIVGYHYRLEGCDKVTFMLVVYASIVLGLKHLMEWVAK